MEPVICMRYSFINIGSIVTYDYIALAFWNVSDFSFAFIWICHQDHQNHAQDHQNHAQDHQNHHQDHQNHM